MYSCAEWTLAFARRWCVLRLSGHRPRLSRVIYIGGTRERARHIGRNTIAGNRIAGGRLPRVHCRGATPRWPRRSVQHLFSFDDDPIARGTCWTSYASPGFAAWSRAYRTRLSCRLRADTRMLVYVAYCQRDSSYYFSLRLDREGHREIDHERSSAIHAEIDFALLATDGPIDKSTWSNIRIRESVSVSPPANLDFL